MPTTGKAKDRPKSTAQSTDEKSLLPTWFSFVQSFNTQFEYFKETYKVLNHLDIMANQTLVQKESFKAPGSEVGPPS